MVYFFALNLLKCLLFDRFEDVRRTVDMQAGVNGFGFVLRNAFGNSCRKNVVINLVVLLITLLLNLLVILSVTAELTARNMISEVSMGTF